ncbi:hypothetical protein SOCEGT47_049710 [Sorangium cellulosum]|uniref:DUF1552 domain-containing protein n=1 Tax=Sorangium cellulosum TaxID=56 RepID=A0A4P2Q612_SORCE|nr:DUF1552 domain-containing protein [Sorangium cellulosum]AUX24433.1 hypothetical protein SOCEGT47_049710 [Sorangium cellulosum]
MRPRLITRRRLLQGSLAATAAIPLLNAELARGDEAVAPKRFVVFYTPNGTLESQWMPTGTETNFTLSPLLEKLEPFKSKLIPLRGINMNVVVNSNIGSEHARGIGGLLTGRALLKGNFRSFMSNNAGWASGISLDQHIANKLKPSTLFRTLELGVQVRDAEVRGRLCYSAPDQPIPPREDPYDTFEQLFGAAVPGQGGSEGGSAALDRLRAQRRTVFELLREEIADVRPRIGAEDRIKLEAHMQSIREIEQRLAGGGAPDGTGAPAPLCKPPALGARIDLSDDANMPAIGQLQMDLAAAALACDLTRIVTIQWSYAESEHLYPFLGLSENHHAISHQWNDAGKAKYTKIHTWFAEQLAYLLGKLDSYKEGDRSLLDNTVVLWVTEISESTQHALTNMPFLLAGSAGGVFRTGRFVDYLANGGRARQHNDLLVTIANAMGTDDTTFGDPEFSTGPLPGLT